MSIIIVNYNGKLFLKDCLRSLAVQTVPRSQFEVILVDNNSWDISVPYVKQHFPWVRVIRSDTNRGFAGGNNLGVESAQGKYVAFLNNDTSVPVDWLKYLLQRIEKSDKIAAVNSKTLLRYPFIELAITSDIFMKADFTGSTDFRSVGVLVEHIMLGNTGLQKLIHYRKGFYEREKYTTSSRWTNGDGRVLIPFDLNDPEITLVVTISRGEGKVSLRQTTHVSMRLGDYELVASELKSADMRQLVVKIPQELARKVMEYEVQNAGNIVFKNGHVRDRGTASTERSQIFELDSPFYNKPCELQAFCGVSVLVRKDIFKKLGWFDETFFMYYEDIDMSLKMREAGFSIYYEPNSVAFHLHSGSSIEWSPFFSYHVERNHLLLVMKHFPISSVIKQSIQQILLLIFALSQTTKWGLKANWANYEKWEERLEYRKNILLWFLLNSRLVLHKRREVARNTKVPFSTIFQELY